MKRSKSLTGSARGERPAPSDGCIICRQDQKFLRRSRRPDYEKIRPAVRIVDLFCGCGGLSMGLAEAARRLGFGIEICMALDNDEDAVAVFEDNFPHADVRCESVESYFDGKLGARITRNEEEIRETLGRVDVIIGGPPCQGYSDLNNHTRRNDPRNALYARMARAAWLLKPTVVLVENVPTVRHDVKKVLHVTMAALRSAGYEVYDSVVDLSVLGVPQRRRRHVMLASRVAGIHPQKVLQSLLVRCNSHSPRSVGWAISNLLAVNGNFFDTPSDPTSKNAKRIAYLFEKDLYDLPNRLRPKCHQSDHSYRSMYGRLRWEEPAQTVTTGFGSMGQGRYVHPKEPRMITPHEAARLQMLPDFMKFRKAKSRGAIAKMIGNSVPPVLGIEIGKSVLKIITRTRKVRPTAPQT